MRDNGLSAASYTSMGEIDAHLTGSVLESLAEAGIAAYAEPPGAADADPPGADPVEPPRDPRVQPSTEPSGTEQVYVDAARADLARAVIRRSTEDAEWRSLVVRFNASTDDRDTAADRMPPRWPAAEDIDETADGSDDGSDDRGTPALTLRTEDDLDPDRRTRDDRHDHYVPPEPARGPRLDWISRLAWFGVLGGPVLLILAALFDVGGSSRITLAGLLGFAGGFLTLVFRMKDRPNVDDTPDDGAVV